MPQRLIENAGTVCGNGGGKGGGGGAGGAWRTPKCGDSHPSWQSGGGRLGWSTPWTPHRHAPTRFLLASPPDCKRTPAITRVLMMFHILETSQTSNCVLQTGTPLLETSKAVATCLDQQSPARVMRVSYREISDLLQQIAPGSRRSPGTEQAQKRWCRDGAPLTSGPTSPAPAPTSAPTDHPSQ